MCANIYVWRKPSKYFYHLHIHLTYFLFSSNVYKKCNSMNRSYAFLALKTEDVTYRCEKDQKDWNVNKDFKWKGLTTFQNKLMVEFESFICHHFFVIKWYHISVWHFFGRYQVFLIIVNIYRDKNTFITQVSHCFFDFRSEFYDFCMGEKLGTHINAPSTYQHYRNGSWSVDQIPINFLVNVPSKYIS